MGMHTMTIFFAMFGAFVLSGTRADGTAEPPASDTAAEGRLPYLGVALPDFNDVAIGSGTANADAIEPNTDTQFWGTVSPGSVAAAPLCKWTDGACKTDISWLHSAVGIEKAFFGDAVTNYILRFQLDAACYRYTRESANNVTRFCADKYFDVGKNQEIKVDEICYNWQWVSGYKDDSSPIWEKFGCFHQAPLVNAVPVPAVTNATDPNPDPAAGSAAGPDPAAETPGSEAVDPAVAPDASASPAPARRMLLDTQTQGDAEAPEGAMPDDTDPTIYSAQADIVDVGTRYETTGIEVLDYDDPDNVSMHSKWFACHERGGSPSEVRACEDNVASMEFGIDAKTVRTLLQLIQNETRGETTEAWMGVGCNRRFTAMVGGGETANEALCEETVSDEATERLVGLGFVGTPQEPVTELLQDSTLPLAPAPAPESALPPVSPPAATPPLGATDDADDAADAGVGTGVGDSQTVTDPVASTPGTGTDGSGASALRAAAAACALPLLAAALFGSI